MPRHLKNLLPIVIAVIILLSGGSLYAATEKAPDEKELKKAEKVLAQLDRLQAAIANPSDKAAARKFSTDLFIKVSGLHEGDIKTELSTAVFLFERADSFLRDGDTQTADCALEVRDLYRNLCLARSPQTRAQLLLAKADLHARWAGALIHFARGSSDDETLATVALMRRERAVDLTLGERALTLLKSLDGKVNAYTSLGDFEEHGRVAEVSFDHLSSDFKTVAAAVRQLLASLPRSLVYYQLQNALSSYADGLFYWQQTYRRKELVVSANNWTAPATNNPRVLDAGVIDYTVVCNWRNARRYITNAAIEIERARGYRIDSTSAYESIAQRR